MGEFEVPLVSAVEPDVVVEEGLSPFPPESDFVLFPEDMDYRLSPRQTDMNLNWVDVPKYECGQYNTSSSLSANSQESAIPGMLSRWPSGSTGWAEAQPTGHVPALSSQVNPHSPSYSSPQPDESTTSYNDPQPAGDGDGESVARPEYINSLSCPELGYGGSFLSLYRHTDRHHQTHEIHPSCTTECFRDAPDYLTMMPEFKRNSNLERLVVHTAEQCSSSGRCGKGDLSMKGNFPIHPRTPQPQICSAYGRSPDASVHFYSYVQSLAKLHCRYRNLMDVIVAVFEGVLPNRYLSKSIRYTVLRPWGVGRQATYYFRSGDRPQIVTFHLSIALDPGSSGLLERSVRRFPNARILLPPVPY
jgi:hypothetical protein